MKNVILQNAHRVFQPSKTSQLRTAQTRIRAFSLSLILSAALVAGCTEPDVSDVTTERTAVTASAVTSLTVISGEELPWDVTLQADPDMIVAYGFERVVDGDTIIVSDPDGEQLRVRLIGIDAPESVHEDESRNTEEGRLASEFLKELLEDTDTVYLEFDAERFDQYGRTLAYVWINTDSAYVMVNEIMLATDHAEPVFFEPNLKYADTFKTYAD